MRGNAHKIFFLLICFFLFGSIIASAGIPEVRVMPNQVNVEEGGATDTYIMYLGTQPAAVVNISFNTGTQIQPISDVTFSAADWWLPKTITVVAVDDTFVEGLHAGTISHTATSADPDYNGIPISNVTANITDNDIPAVLVNPLQVDLSEDGVSDTYAIVLQTQPAAEVVISFNTGTQVQPISTVTFTSVDWSIPKTITAFAVDDAVVEGPHTGTISHSAASADPDYNGIAIPSVTANITDNDLAPAVIVSPTDVDLVEGGASDTYTIVLQSMPTADVIISFNTGTQVQPISSITFTSVNWSIPQTITALAVDDSIAEGLQTGTISHSAASADPNYNGISISSVIANITDNDVAGVTVTPTQVDLVEGGPGDTYTIVLTSQPTASVTISFNTGSQVQPISNITFTTANWSIPKTITANAVDDAIIEGPHAGAITHSAASTDPIYNLISVADVTANITDNDIAGVLVTPLQVDISEDGVSDTYTIVLQAQPAANVNISFNTGTQVQPISGIVFTSVDWSIPKTITVFAVDDGIVEGSHTGTISHTAVSADPNYNGISISNVTANITDNDIAGVLVTPAQVDLAEGGASDTYTIVLQSQPSANVVISFNTGTQVQPISNITFTTVNWSIPQVVTALAVDDAIVEGSHTGTISHNATSSDGNYDGIVISDVTANITDNDGVAGVVVTPAQVNVAEGGASDSYTIVLLSQPAADVTISFNPGSQIQPIADIVFNSTDWSIPKTITVFAVDDAIVEGSHTGTIVHIAASADGNYDGIAITDVTANITDNDGTDEITVTPTTVDVAEGGANGTYTISLSSEPQGDVVISFDTGTQLQPIADVTFTPADWSTPRTITVSAVDDSDLEGPHTGTITHSVFSTDPDYNGDAIPNVTANIADNDLVCLFDDDFEDGTIDLSKWAIVKTAWSETGGKLSGTPSKRKAVITTAGFPGCSSDCTIETTMETAGGLFSRVWLLGWQVDKRNRMELLMKEAQDKWILKQRVERKVVAKQKALMPVNPNVAYNVVLSFDGTDFHVSINGADVITLRAVVAPTGIAGFQAKNTTGSFSYICIH